MWAPALLPILALLFAVSGAMAGPMDGMHQMPVVVEKGSEELPLVIEERDGIQIYRKTVLSPVHQVDAIYKSMQGPMNRYRFTLRKSPHPELLWLTGYEAVMVEPDGETRMSQEYMCHSNLNTPLANYERLFPSEFEREEVRLFSLAQGQLKIDLPRGFGMPILSTQRLEIQSQILNANDLFSDFGARHKITLEFVRDAELLKRPIPLFSVPAYGMKLIDGPDGYYGVAPEAVDEEVHGQGCMPAGVVPVHASHPDPFGRTFTGHWNVEPGPEENHTLVTQQMKLPYDTTIHYIAAHLHPFAESLELYDLTAGESVYRTRTRNTPERIGLDEVQYMSSAQGIPIFKDHEYEVVSYYNNTTDEPQTAMAGFFLYLRAKDLESRIRTPDGRRLDPAESPPARAD